MTEKNWTEKTYYEMDPNETSWANYNITRTQDKLSGIYFGCAERAIKSLFLLSGGGTIATLSVERAKNLHVPLYLFLAALLLSLALVGIDFFQSFFIKGLRVHRPYM